MPEESRVSFLVAGAPQSGAAALFAGLRTEPRVSLSIAAEPHFFDDDTRAWPPRDYEPYHAHFAPFDGRPRGEATSTYLYWPHSLERLAAYNPALRVVILLRDPALRAWSHWRANTAKGLERQPFAWSIRQGRQRLFEAEPWGFDRDIAYVEQGFYGEQMARLLGLFPRRQVLVLRAEDLGADPVTTLSKVGDFLGLVRPSAPAAGPIPPRLGDVDAAEMAAADLAHLRGVYARDQQRLQDLTGVQFG